MIVGWAHRDHAKAGNVQTSGVGSGSPPYSLAGASYQPIKKPAAWAGFALETAENYFSSSDSSFRILAPVGPVSALPSLACTVTSLAVAPWFEATSTR